MDKKYIGAQVVLPTSTAVELDVVRKELELKFGFEPSRSEAIRFLIHEHNKREKLFPIHKPEKKPVHRRIE